MLVSRKPVPRLSGRVRSLESCEDVLALAELDPAWMAEVQEGYCLNKCKE
jgi:hypothetical protein